jgi:hypothetical protein
MDILTEEIKNTRFILTLVAVLGLFAVAAAAFVLLVLHVEVDQSIMLVFTTAQGAIIGLTTVAYNSYFKDRQAQEAQAQVTQVGAG